MLGLPNWCTVGCSLLISPNKVGILEQKRYIKLTHVYIADNMVIKFFTNHSVNKKMCGWLVKKEKKKKGKKKYKNISNGESFQPLLVILVGCCRI